MRIWPASVILAGAVALHGTPAWASDENASANGGYSNSIELRDLARLGRAARGHLPGILRQIESDEPELRVAAARALGFIGGPETVDVLTELLDDERDVQLDWVAAEALGSIGEPSALPTLRRVAESHWYPPVREAATEAVERILSGGPSVPFDDRGFANVFFQYEQFGRSVACEGIRARFLPAEIASATDARQIETFRRSHNEKLKAEEPTVQTPYGEFRLESVDLLHKPHTVIPVEGGWLAGSDDGEWGGELAYYDASGTVENLLAQNVFALFELDRRILALTGLAHMSANRGYVYRIEKPTGEGWRAVPWRGLPGAPRAMRIEDTGELVVDTYWGGTVAIDPQGQMRMAPCL